ncbi:MAG: hypothetical protein Q8N13_22550 [Acidovorax sp.]|nr:hypothetical protein [Acidovorax sp.]
MVPNLLIAEKAEQRQQILSVISQIEHRLRSGRHRVKLDFSLVKKIFPGGMLLLLAALSQLADTYSGRISARCPPNSLAAQLLNHFGLAKKLKVNLRLSRPTHNSVLAWSFLTGTQAAGEQVTALLNRYREGTNAAIPEGLFAVLTEGLTNVRQHAYKGLAHIPESWRKWWLFARYEEPKLGADGSLYIAIYDIGEGIPVTMRNKLKRNEIVVDLLDKGGKHLSLSDGVMLDKKLMFEAVEHRRSQTGEGHRGNGLPEMKDFAASNQGGRLHIISGRVQYSIVRGSSEGQVHGHRDELPGTLLLWGLPLMAKES